MSSTDIRVPGLRSWPRRWGRGSVAVRCAGSEAGYLAAVPQNNKYSRNNIRGAQFLYSALEIHKFKISQRIGASISTHSVVWSVVSSDPEVC